MSIKENHKRIKDNIENAIRRSNRENDVTLIAVTKQVDVDTAQEIKNEGIIHLGENRFESLFNKQDEIQGVNWHFIGSLQTRKVKEVINRIDYLHSLDRLSLAEEIQKRAENPIKCFVQVNVSGEESKHGLNPDAVIGFIRSISELDKIQVIGLMTMAPFTEDEQIIRASFNGLKKLQQEIKNLHILNAPCTELSMGMSNDYEIAIEEGATFIRIGTSLVQKG
ncbi:YggS family pyridoxal phosphate-dependent enzyme [Bacillus sp. RG28]|uniref:Pyridoxal phosphate homeostasis protein n=1 Tax=Gottfriedia endophytica TaxID=2820819 RepID=A0A940NQ33_9BACI|nr:YggS family pyridoxal phosphate-dependent enzyme [Gottfriedia endophytica]MBP0724826.1 YggS family pyridoxal phosphate-dependent enzyme [Gottfriedia endophytica]